MGLLVYMLCALTALACAVLLLRAHGRTGSPLLFWSGLCFIGLTLNNAFTALDLVLLRDGIDLFLLRNVTALVAMLLLLYGLIWRAE